MTINIRERAMPQSQLNNSRNPTSSSNMSHPTTQVNTQAQHEVSVLWFKGPHQEIGHQVSIFIHGLHSLDGKGTNYNLIFVSEDGISPKWMYVAATAFAPRLCDELGGQIVLGTLTDPSHDELQRIIAHQCSRLRDGY